MNYIIFDLEWNNAYSYANKKYINEIIEIGAIKLDSRLNIVDTFKQLVKPRFSKKLSSRCKNLTKITNEEISKYGIPFEKAVADFRQWSGSEKTVFLSWSNSDLYVLVNNYSKIIGNCDIDFIKYYCDAQKYCMSFINQDERHINNQIGLANCAKIFDIDVDVVQLHRALADCYLTAECLKKVFDLQIINEYVCKCDSSFFERLLYKPYYISELVSNLFNINDVNIECPVCGGKTMLVSPYVSINKTFRGAVKCERCDKTFWSYVRAKKNYDDIVISKKAIEMNKRKAKKINN